MALDRHGARITHESRIYAAGSGSLPPRSVYRKNAPCADNEGEDLVSSANGEHECKTDKPRRKKEFPAIGNSDQASRHSDTAVFLPSPYPPPPTPYPPRQMPCCNVNTVGRTATDVWRESDCRNAEDSVGRPATSKYRNTFTTLSTFVKVARSHVLRRAKVSPVSVYTRGAARRVTGIFLSLSVSIARMQFTVSPLRALLASLAR
jgi:hypothetical protein